MTTVINIADPRVVALPIVECHELLVNLKEQSELLYGPPPETPLTEPDYTRLRKTVFDKICAAQKNLPEGWCFRVYEGYRSLRVQKILFDQQYEKALKEHEGKDLETIFYETTRLVSPVLNFDGSENIPPHNTGAAVDIEIINEEGNLIEMGMTAAEWHCVDPALCQTNCTTISAEAQENRKLLLTVMEAEGFVNYPTEWWHFSYGDRYWAYDQKKSEAIYGSVEASH